MRDHDTRCTPQTEEIPDYDQKVNDAALASILDHFQQHLPVTFDDYLKYRLAHDLQQERRIVRWVAGIVNGATDAA